MVGDILFCSFKNEHFHVKQHQIKKCRAHYLADVTKEGQDKVDEEDQSKYLNRFNYNNKRIIQGYFMFYITA